MTFERLVSSLGAPPGHSQDTLWLLLEWVPVPLTWATFPQGRIIHMNQKFQQTYGYTAADFSCIPEWVEATYVQAEHRERAMATWTLAWNNPGMPQQREVPEIEIDVRCANGTVRHVLHQGVILPRLEIAIAVFTDISANKRAERDALRHAHEDPLTGLANRRGLEAHWASLRQRRWTEATLLTIDLDDFKPVNDRYGHAAGDMALRRVAAAIRSMLAPGDIAARLGGDEFAVLLEHGNGDAAETFCARLTGWLAQPLELPAGLCRLGASIGLSRFPQDGTELGTLLRQADAALYRAKQHGKGSWAWHRLPEQGCREPPRH